MPWVMSRNRRNVFASVSRAVTVDEGPRNPRGRGELDRMGERARYTSRDLERYAGLFASRTREMKSSAMRDMMAITQRPDVISLAGGLPETGSFAPESFTAALPDTGRFPPQSFAAATHQMALESTLARALQYGPTEGLDELKDCIVEV